MSIEKKSLIRFLIIYIFSTLFLVLALEYFYFKNSYTQIINFQKESLKKEIVSSLKYKRMFEIFNIPYTIYIDKKLVKGNLPYINQEFVIKNNKIFYKYTLIRGFRTIDIIAFTHISKKVDNLKKELIVFNIFFVVFLIFISFILGKIFIAPMKKRIENLENFIRDTTHEINTPISIINSNIELIEIKNINLKEIKRIKSATIRLSQIFENLKLLYLLQNVKKGKYNLKDIISQRINFFETELNKKSLKVKVDLFDKYIFISYEEILRLIDNLLFNAIKFSPVNSTISICLKDDFLEIKNKGEIENKNIKDKFVKGKNGGFGLGLFIVQNICDKYGFKFEIFQKNSYVINKIYF